MFISFNNRVGDLPTRLSDFFYVGQAGNMLKLEAVERYTGPIEFTGIQYGFTRTNVFDGQYQTFENFHERSGGSVRFSYLTLSSIDPVRLWPWWGPERHRNWRYPRDRANPISPGRRNPRPATRSNGAAS